MTLTFVSAMAVALRVALAGVRLINPRRRPALVPVRTPDDGGWRPHVLSGCGR